MIELGRASVFEQLARLFQFKGSARFSLSEEIVPVANLTGLDEPPFHYKSGGLNGLRLANGIGTFGVIALKFGIPTASTPPQGAPVGVCRKIIVANNDNAVTEYFLSCGTPSSGGFTGFTDEGTQTSRSWDRGKRTLGHIMKSTASGVDVWSTNGKILFVMPPLSTQVFDFTPGGLVFGPAVNEQESGVVVGLSDTAAVHTYSASFLWDEYPGT